MPNDVHIDITAINRTKQGWESAINDAVTSATKIEQSVETAQRDIAGTADKIGHTGEVASKMAINLLQAFGLSGDKAKVLEGILRQVDDGFDALGKAAHLAQAANLGVAGSNTAVAGTAGIAMTAMRGLTAAMIANPVTATLVGIGVAVTAVAAAFELWPKATVNIEEMNEKLRKQQELMDKLLEATNKRAKAETNAEKLEDRGLQRLAIKALGEIKNVEAAERAARLATEKQETAESEARTQAIRLKILVEELALLKEAARVQNLTETNSFAGLQNAQRTKEVQELINKELEKHQDFEKQALNFKAQSEAAQDRALALPEELQKKELERIEKTKKAEAELEKQRLKQAADRLEAENLYGEAIGAMFEDKKRKAAEDEKDRSKRLEDEELYADVIEEMNEEKRKNKAEFVGLEDLTRGIQLAALAPTRAQNDAKENKAVFGAMKDALEVIKDAVADTKTIEEGMAVDTKKVAEKIDMVGRLS